MYHIWIFTLKHHKKFYQQFNKAKLKFQGKWASSGCNYKESCAQAIWILFIAELIKVLQ